MIRPQLLSGVTKHVGAQRTLLGSVAHLRAAPPSMSRALSSCVLSFAKAHGTSSAEHLPPKDAPTDQKASTLENASRAHKLAIDPDTVVTPNATAATTTREANVEAQMHKPRHAGENPPGVPPQALKRAPETFNIKIPFPSLTPQAVQKPFIPLVVPASGDTTYDEGVKNPPSVLAVSDSERVHTPAAHAGLSKKEEAALEKEYATPQLSILQRAGVPAE